MVNSLKEIEDGLKLLCECEMFCKQNNKDDKNTLKKLGTNDFFTYVKNNNINNIINDLKTKITDKNEYYYLGKRIHNTISANIEEKLFEENKEVTLNPIVESKEYDFIIENENGKFVYDLKSTRLKNSRCL